MIDATEEKTKDNKLDTSNNSFDELKSKLKENTDQHIHCEKLYSELVIEFFKKYQVQQSFIDCNFEKYDCNFVLQNQYEIEAFNKFCIKHIKDNFDNHKICKNEQFFFNYYADLFFNSVEFVTKTFDEIMKLKKEFKLNGATIVDKIGEDSKLMKKLILSCDWIQKIKDNTNFCFLYNFNSFTPYEINTLAVCFNYSILMRPFLLDKLDTTYLEYVQEYLKEKKFDTLQDMLAIEKVQKIINWFDGKQKTYNAKIIEKKLEIILNHISSEKSFNTQIDYIAKKGYFNINDEGYNFKTFKKSEQFESTMRILKLEETYPYFYKLNISAYCMYKEETIIATTNIIELINNKIDDLKKNTNIITEHLFDIIKRKIIDVVQENKDIETNIADSIIQQINKIKKTSVEEFFN
ncbi:hypothetical protein BDAP_002105 [Binucleata daphniae]